jgi:alkylation response protein AidB-like acyl-CoA dehydrogenase
MCVFSSSERADGAERTQRPRDRDDLRWLLTDRRGRRFLWRLLDEAGLFDAAVSREGKRRLGLDVLRDVLAADPAAYLAMIQENGSGDGGDGL